MQQKIVMAMQCPLKRFSGSLFAAAGEFDSQRSIWMRQTGRRVRNHLVKLRPRDIKTLECEVQFGRENRLNLFARPQSSFNIPYSREENHFAL